MNGKPLESAKRCLTLLTQHRVCISQYIGSFYLFVQLFLQSKENIGLVLVGTDKTENDIADSNGNFSHISLIRPLGPYGWDLLKTLDTKISSSDINGDCTISIIILFTFNFSDRRHFCWSRSSHQGDKVTVIKFNNLQFW